MTAPRRLLAGTLGLGIAVVSSTLVAGPASAALPAKAGKQTVEGKLSWTVVRTYKDDGDPANPSRETREENVEENHTLQVKALRDPGFTRTYVFEPKKTEYTYSYTMTSLSREYTFGQLGCERTTEATSAGSGKTGITPSVFGKYNPDKDVLVIDKRTKGISVGAGLPGTGTTTTVQRGVGLSPCQDGQWTDPLDQSGSTSLNDSRQVCLPSGLKRPPSSYRPLFGKWNNKKKRFDFACTDTFTSTNETTKITVSGSLKYKR
jgi:hypothetical protein